MPTHHDETLLERYQREHRTFERMNMSDHTDGKLCVSSKHPRIIKMHDFMGETDVMVASASGMTNSGFFPTDDEAIANARRLVAAWNACECIPTDDLEACPGGGLFHLADHANQLAIEHYRLSAINAELLEALKDLTGVITAAGLSNLSRGVQLGPTVWYVKASDAMESSLAAIAKAQGEQ